MNNIEETAALPQNQFKIANIFGNIGLGVFIIVAALVPLAQFEFINVDPNKVLKFFTVISGLLLSFLAGTIWSEALIGKIERTATHHMVISAGFATSALMGFVLQNRWSIMLFGLSYLLLFFIEDDLRKKKVTEIEKETDNDKVIHNYLYMRRHLTYKVVIVHLCLLVFYIIHY